MANDFNKYFKHYLDLVEGMEPMVALQNTHREFLSLIDNIPEDKGDYRYEPEKWTVKEVLSHIIDVERVFAYRAMRFARNDDTALAGFDDKLYAQYSNSINRSLASMKGEFDILRQSTITLFTSFDEAMWPRGGTANNIEFTVRSLALLIAGHSRHHGIILRKRYKL